MKDSVSESGSVRLRPIRASDAGFMFECERDAEARRNFMTTPKSVAAVRNGIRKAIRERGKARPGSEELAIEWRGRTVGRVWITGMAARHAEHKACIGIMIHRDFRGRGIGTRAIRLLTAYAFGKYKLKRIYTYTRASNRGSRRILEKAGYKLEGILRKDALKDGKYLNNCLYARVR